MEIELYGNSVLWFDKYSSTFPDLNVDITDPKEDSNEYMQIAALYDFETLKDDEYRFYFVLNLRFPNLAALSARFSFRLKEEEFDWDNFFTEGTIREIIVTCMPPAFDCFIETCNEQGVELPPDFERREEESEKFYDFVSKDIIANYHKNREPLKLANSPDASKIDLVCPKSGIIHITMNAVFITLDEILFNNQRFNLLSNRKTFFDVVPELRFYTLKEKCLEIANHDVEISVVNMGAFLNCVDCAMQMLLGDKGDYLIPVLEHYNITKEYQKDFFQSVTSLFTTYNEKGKSIDPGYSFANHRKEWNSLIQ